jgi:hypothetical protein
MPFFNQKDRNTEKYRLDMNLQSFRLMGRRLAVKWSDMEPEWLGFCHVTLSEVTL